MKNDKLINDLMGTIEDLNVSTNSEGVVMAQKKKLMASEKSEVKKENIDMTATSKGGANAKVVKEAGKVLENQSDSSKKNISKSSDLDKVKDKKQPQDSIKSKVIAKKDEIKP